MKKKYRVNKKHRLSILTSHPIQYQVPLFRKLAEHPRIDLTVFFCSDYGVTEKMDPGFGVALKWDVPLLGGYKYKFLRNFWPKPGLGRFWSLLNFGIVRELHKHKCDAIFLHSYSYATHLMAISAARLRGIPILVRSEPNLLVKISKLRGILKESLLPLLLKSVDACMSIGKLNRQYYQHYHVPKEKIFHMPYAVDNEWFFEQRDLYLHRKREIKRGIGLDGKQKIILYLSKFLTRKRPMDLVQAFEGLDTSNTALVMVGDGEEKSRCEAYVERRRVKDVYFLGFRNQSEVAKFYAIADVFVLPSENEPWGLAVNEAMCFGVPVIVTDEVGAGYDLIRNGENGFSYQVGNIDRLRTGLQAILNNEELQRQMGAMSIDIIQKWGIDENLQAILKALDENVR